MVDRIRIGEHGYAMVVAPDGALVAHGDPDKKALVAQSHNMSAIRSWRPSARRRTAPPVSLEYVDADRRSNLGVAARIPPLGWTVIVEQPTDEAYATATQLQRPAVRRHLDRAARHGRRRLCLRPIVHHADPHAEARHPGGGRRPARDARRHPDRRRVRRARRRLQHDGRPPRRAAGERQAPGAAGDVRPHRRRPRARPLAPDSEHRQQRAAHGARRRRSPKDARCSAARSTASSATLKRFMDDLRNVVKPKPVERFPMDVNGSVAEIVDSMRPEGERHGVTIEAHYAAGPLVIEGDRFALGRVYRNLITNAIQATAAGRPRHHRDRRALGTSGGDQRDRHRLGHPARAAVAPSSTTSSRPSARGLGLGLAISKRIVEQLDGTITVESEVGRGTAFTLRFPARGSARRKRPRASAAAEAGTSPARSRRCSEHW